MLLEKIATLSELETALNAQLKQIKSDRKALERKQAKLSEFLELQAELMNDPDTSDTLTGASTVTTTPRLIEIESFELLPELRVIEIEWDEPTVEIAPAPHFLDDASARLTEAYDEPTVEIAPASQLNPAPDTAPDTDTERADFYKRIEGLMKLIDLKQKEARKTLEIMFGNGIISRDQLDKPQLEKFITHLEAEHTKQQQQKAAALKVEWLDERGGTTTDADEIVRQFTCSKWDAATPEFELITQGEKTIKSTWETTKNNSHFIAIKRSLPDFFLQHCDLQLGYILRIYDGLPDNAKGIGEIEFTVWKEGQKLGTISRNYLNNWTHSRLPRRGIVTTFAWVQDCLQALETAYHKANAEAEKTKVHTESAAKAVMAKYAIGLG